MNINTLTSNMIDQTINRISLIDDSTDPRTRDITTIEPSKLRNIDISIVSEISTVSKDVEQQYPQYIYTQYSDTMDMIKSGYIIDYNQMLLDLLIDISMRNGIYNKKMIKTKRFRIQCGEYLNKELINILNIHKCHIDTLSICEHEILNQSYIIDHYYGDEFIEEKIYNRTLLSIISELEILRINYKTEKSKFRKSKILIEYYNYKRANYDIDESFTSKYDEALINCTRLYVNNYQEIDVTIERRKFKEMATKFISSIDYIYKAILINPAHEFTIQKVNEPCSYVERVSYDILDTFSNFTITYDETDLSDKFNTIDEKGKLITEFNMLNINDVEILTRYIMHFCNLIFSERNKQIKHQSHIANIQCDARISVGVTKLLQLHIKLRSAINKYKETHKEDIKYIFMYYLACVFVIENKYQQLIDCILWCDSFYLEAIYNIIMLRNKSADILIRFLPKTPRIDSLLTNIAQTKSLETTLLLRDYLINLNESGWFHSREQIIDFKNTKESQLFNLKTMKIKTKELIDMKIITDSSNINITNEVEKVSLILNKINDTLAIDTDTYNKKKEIYMHQLRAFHMEVSNCIDHLAETTFTDSVNKITYEIINILLEIIVYIFHENFIGKLENFNYINLINATHISIHNQLLSTYEKLVKYIFTYDQLLPNICPRYRVCSMVLNSLSSLFVSTNRVPTINKLLPDIKQLLINDSYVVNCRVESNSMIKHKLRKLNRQSSVQIEKPSIISNHSDINDEMTHSIDSSINTEKMIEFDEQIHLSKKMKL